MRMTGNTTRITVGSGARFIAKLPPDSPDPDARADAANPAVLAALEVGWRSALEPGGQISQEELLQELAPTKDELAAADAELDALEAEEEEAEQAPSAAARRPRRRTPRIYPPGPNGTTL